MENLKNVFDSNGYLLFDENGIIIPLKKKEFFGMKKTGMIILPMVVHSDDYVEGEFAKYALQLKTFAEKTPGAFATKYGLSVPFLAEALKDSDFVNYFVSKYVQVGFFAKSFTNRKDELLNGTGVVLVAFPTPIDTVTGMPLSVAPGTTTRFREKAQFIKNQKGKYLVADGEIMYIEKIHSVFDPTTGKPVFSPSLVGGGHPHLDYTKSKFSGVEIQKDSNDGHGFVFADKTTNPSWVDNSPLPAANTSALWKYQGIYLLNNVRQGNWSDPVSVTVKGV